MKIIIHDCPGLQSGTPNSLLGLFPRHLNARLDNFGQGEGQVELAGTIWGFYWRDNKTSYLQFEEGTLSWPELQTMVAEIVRSISEQLGREVEFSCEGWLTCELARQKKPAPNWWKRLLRR